MAKRTIDFGKSAAIFDGILVDAVQSNVEGIEALFRVD